jgi:hypothetical protein
METHEERGWEHYRVMAETLIKDKSSNKPEQIEDWLMCAGFILIVIAVSPFILFVWIWNKLK